MKSASQNMSDHQDSDHFTYAHTWEEIEVMLDKAERKMNNWVSVYFAAQEKNNRKIMKDAARNKKALEGVIKSLRWVLGDKDIKDPLN
jgi:L-lactate utilization protein LutB